MAVLIRLNGVACQRAFAVGRLELDCVSYELYGRTRAGITALVPIVIQRVVATNLEFRTIVWRAELSVAKQPYEWML